jgi:cobalt transporter subunit CbtA
MGHEAATGEHVHDANAWGPQDGLERTFYTTLTAILTAAGFALLLTGISFLAGIPITRNNGLIWGLCGFVSVSLAPAIGLPPELPGMPAAGLVARQAWWIGTIVCTGFAIWLTVARLPWFKYLGAIALALLPHVFGAPHPPDQTTSVPAGLAAEFATASLGANLLMWLLIGLFLSLALSAHEEAVTS